MLYFLCTWTWKTFPTCTCMAKHRCTLIISPCVKTMQWLKTKTQESVENETFSLVPPPQTGSRCVWGDTGWMCVCVFRSYPNMREVTARPPPPSESSAATRRPGLIRSPSFLSSPRPQPTPPAPLFPGQLEGAAAGRQGFKRPTQPSQ